MARKSLTFKQPDSMKLFALIFIVCFIFSPAVRYGTASILHTVANIIEPQS